MDTVIQEDHTIHEPFLRSWHRNTTVPTSVSGGSTSLSNAAAGAGSRTRLQNMHPPWPVPHGFHTSGAEPVPAIASHRTQHAYAFAASQIRSLRRPWPGTSSSRAGTASPASASPASGAAPPRRGATSSSSGTSPSASSPTASPPTPPVTTPPSSPPIPSRTPCVPPPLDLYFLSLSRRRRFRRSVGSFADDFIRARCMSRRRSARKWCPWRNSP